MLTILSARDSDQHARQRNAALKMGLPFEPRSATSAEVTYQDATKVLAIIKEAGGSVSKPYTRTMTRAEML